MNPSNIIGAASSEFVLEIFMKYDVSHSPERKRSIFVFSINCLPNNSVVQVDFFACLFVYICKYVCNRMTSVEWFFRKKGERIIILSSANNVICSLNKLGLNNNEFLPIKCEWRWITCI